MPKGVPKSGKRRLHPLAEVRTGSSLRLPGVPAALDEASKRFEEAAGGRDSLIAHLCHLALTPEQSLVVGAIADPENHLHSLGRICQLADVTFGDLLQLFRQAGFAKAQVEAMQRVWAQTPAVAEDTMTRALPHYLPCSPCRGRGEVKVRVVDEQTGKPTFPAAFAIEECNACGGDGVVLQQPDLPSRRLALELSGLVKVPGGAEVNVAVDARQGLFSQKILQQFAAASDALFYPVAPPQADEPVEAEVLRAERVEKVPVDQSPAGSGRR